jgi:integrase
MASAGDGRREPIPALCRNQCWLSYMSASLLPISRGQAEVLLAVTTRDLNMMFGLPRPPSLYSVCCIELANHVVAGNEFKVCPGCQRIFQLTKESRPQESSARAALASAMTHVRAERSRRDTGTGRPEGARDEADRSYREASWKYFVVLELETDQDAETGDRVRKRKGAGGYRTCAEAKEALSEAIERSRHGWRGPSRSTVTTFLRDEWLPGVEMEHAATTAALYRTIIETYVVPHIGGIRLDALAAGDLTNLYRELLKSEGRRGRPLAPKLVRHVHTTLRKAFSDAVASNLMAWNPATAAKPPWMSRTQEPAAWTAEELGAFLHAVNDERLQALWVLAGTTGLRRGELLGLRWTDLDLNRSTLGVRQTRVAYGKLVVTKEPKMERGRRTIPLPARTRDALKAHRKRQVEEELAAGAAYADVGLVFADEIGEPLDPPNLTATFRRLVAEAGLPRITLHGLRHTFATVAVEAGVDVLYVAELLGHSSPAITQSAISTCDRSDSSGLSTASPKRSVN